MHRESILNVGLTTSDVVTNTPQELCNCLPAWDSVLSSHKFHSRFCSSVYTFFVLFFGLTPTTDWSRMVLTCSHSTCKHSMTFQTDGTWELVIPTFWYIVRPWLVIHRHLVHVPLLWDKQRWDAANSNGCYCSRVRWSTLSLLQFTWHIRLIKVRHESVGCFRRSIFQILHPGLLDLR